MGKKLYFLTLFLLLSVDSIGGQGPPGDTYYCGYCSYVFMKPKEKSCENYLCWESQLTDINRISLINYFNDYRKKVAAGTCASCEAKSYAPVFEMTYHWLLELMSIYRLQTVNCTLPVQFQKKLVKLPFSSDSMYDYNLVKAPYFHYGISSYLLMNNDFRDDAINRVQEILNDEDRSATFLQAWIIGDNSSAYLHGRTPLFGCSILIKDNYSGITSLGEVANNSRVAILMCHFSGYRFQHKQGSLEGDPSTEKCQLTNVNSNLNTKTNLCSNDWSSNPSKTDIPCQIYYETTKFKMRSNFCDGPVPSSWRYNTRPRKYDQVIQVQLLDEERRQHLPILIENIYVSTTTVKYPTDYYLTTTTESPTTGNTTAKSTPLIDPDPFDSDCNSDSPSLSCYTSKIVIFFIICLILIFILQMLFRNE